MRDLSQIYQSNNYVVIDLEVATNHGDYGAPVYSDNQLLLACYRLGPGHPAAQVPGELGTIWPIWGNELEQSVLLQCIDDADFIVAHNAKYELGWLKRCGADLRKIVAFDTKLAEYVLLGNLAAGGEGVAPRSTSLDSCCIRRGWEQKDPAVDHLIKDGVNPIEIPRAWLQGRCEQDVDTTERLFLSQREALLRTNRMQTLWRRCTLTPVLVEMEMEGMALDATAVEEEYIKQAAICSELTREMNALTGGINWRSSKQVAEFIYDKLGFKELTKPGGKPKRTAKDARLTDQKSLALLVATTPEQKAFIKVRRDIGAAQALLTKNLEFFRGVCKAQNGVFHAELNQTNTATHRLSSSGKPIMLRNEEGELESYSVQMQNVPRRLKKLFVAKRPGYVIMEIDGAQLEARVAAEISRDPAMMADIENPDFDFHVLSGATMAQKNFEELLQAYRAGDKKAAEIRQAGKPETFKPIYGGKKGTKAQERWYAEFRRRYNVLASTQQAWVDEVVRTKRLITPWGMRYYWPFAKMSDSGYVNVETQVANYPVQALATAEIIPVAIRALWDRLAGWEGVCFVNTVHDSVVLEVRDDAALIAKLIQEAKLAFTTDVYNHFRAMHGMEFAVPLGIGVKYGTHLGEGKEMKWNVYPGGREVESK